MKSQRQLPPGALGRRRLQHRVAGRRCVQLAWARVLPRVGRTSLPPAHADTVPRSMDTSIPPWVDDVDGVAAPDASWSLQAFAWDPLSLVRRSKCAGSVLSALVGWPPVSAHASAARCLLACRWPPLYLAALAARQTMVTAVPRRTATVWCGGAAWRRTQLARRSAAVWTCCRSGRTTSATGAAPWHVCGEVAWDRTHIHHCARFRLQAVPVAHAGRSGAPVGRHAPSVLPKVRKTIPLQGLAAEGDC